ncbi:hypothetical protein [Maribacter sp. 2307ULW6-5]|uniref:hypothetical protein n=1 Tax=Maribacter sp. 2307ULW6-5 TaxID=3386275 RepID=UPI0039BD254B
MAKEKLVPIKEALLKNNCPECFNQELKLRFYQKHTYGTFLHRTTKEVTHQIVCKKCNSMIYPVKWTDDIERMFNYYQKTVEPEPKSIKPTWRLYLLLFLLFLLAAVATYFLLGGTITY